MLGMKIFGSSPSVLILIVLLILLNIKQSIIMIKKRGDDHRDALIYDDLVDQDSEVKGGHGHTNKEDFHHWPHVFNLTNCIVGVSILAMPYCLQQCGILLGVVLIFLCSILTKATCHFLYKSAVLSRRKSYEALAFYAFGSTGRRLVELLMVLYLISTTVSFMVIIGDIGPHVLADYLQLLAPTQRLRILVMVLVLLFVILPLSMIRNLVSLSIISSITVVFYFIFVARMLIECFPRIFDGQWSQDVHWWRTEGVLTSLPIISMALSCQTQLFCVADCIKEPGISKVDSVVAGAVNLCSGIYAAVGVFGYVAFHDIVLHGDVLLYLQSTLFTQIIKLGFMLSVAVSIPLMLFPTRTACYNLFLHSDVGEFTVVRMSSTCFYLLTIVILFSSMLIAILIPNVEFVLGLTGALIGSLVTIVIPSLLFITITPNSRQNASLLRYAKVAVLSGLLMLIGSTLATLRAERQSSTIDVILPKSIVEQNIADQIKNENFIASYSLKDPSFNDTPSEQIKAKGLREKNKDNGNEAKRILDEIRQQQKEQKKMIEKQKAILEELKEHKDMHLEKQKTNESSKVARSVSNINESNQKKTDKNATNEENVQSVVNKEKTKQNMIENESQTMVKKTEESIEARKDANMEKKGDGKIFVDIGKSNQSASVTTNSVKQQDVQEFAQKGEN